MDEVYDERKYSGTERFQTNFRTFKSDSNMNFKKETQQNIKISRIWRDEDFVFRARGKKCDAPEIFCTLRVWSLSLVQTDYRIRVCNIQ